MKRRRDILTVLGLAATVVLIVATWPGEREPEYQGKKLSEWLEVCAESPTGDEPEAVRERRKDQAADAVRHIGTNALPCLMNWAFYEPSELKQRSLGWLAQTTYGSRIKHRVYPGEKEKLRNLSLEGFTILGKEAGPVIPVAVRAMNALGSRGDWPMLILRCLGDTGLPSLMQVITNRANSVAFRACALKYVGWECTNSAWAVAPLSECLGEEDEQIVAGAAYALGDLAQAPEIAVPALAASLRHPNPSVRVNAIRSLGRFKESAQSAAPAIVEGFADSELNVRRTATNAMRRVAPALLH